MTTLKPLIIVGAGGLGREVAWLISDINRDQEKWNFMGFADDGAHTKTVEDYPIIGPVSAVMEMRPRPWVAIAIADSRVRAHFFSMFDEAGVPIATLIHPSAALSEHVSVGKGSIICTGAVLTTNVRLGVACILNPGNFIGHDTELGDFVSLMPMASIAGEVRVGTGCFFGMNSCVINKKNIGNWTTVGAGAAVISDLPSYSVAVGVPAKIVKNLSQTT